MLASGPRCRTVDIRGPDASPSSSTLILCPSFELWCRRLLPLRRCRGQLAVVAASSVPRVPSLDGGGADRRFSGSSLDPAPRRWACHFAAVLLLLSAVLTHSSAAAFSPRSTITRLIHSFPDYITNVQKRLGNRAWTGFGQCRLCGSFLDPPASARRTLRHRRSHLGTRCMRLRRLRWTETCGPRHHHRTWRTHRSTTSRSFHYRCCARLLEEFHHLGGNRARSLPDLVLRRALVP